MPATPSSTRPTGESASNSPWYALGLSEPAEQQARANQIAPSGCQRASRSSGVTGARSWPTSRPRPARSRSGSSSGPVMPWLVVTTSAGELRASASARAAPVASTFEPSTKSGAVMSFSASSSKSAYSGAAIDSRIRVVMSCSPPPRSTDQMTGASYRAPEPAQSLSSAST